MKTPLRSLVAALAAGAALAAAPLLVEARPGGGGGGGGGSNAGGGGGGNWQGGGGGKGGSWHGGGYRGGGYHYGGYRGWHGGYRGWYGWGYRPYWGVGYYWPGYYWGVGAGLATVAYAAPYYNYYGGYYGYPAAYAPPVTEYVVSEPQPGDQVVRSGQPVPQTPPPEPIFYPRNGQSPAQTEADRQDCNRWATTQQNALSDAQVFQRATYACMDGRGYTVR
jgi:hypothetical protein